jgi:hypothetical protein
MAACDLTTAAQAFAGELPGTGPTSLQPDAVIDALSLANMMTAGLECVLSGCSCTVQPCSCRFDPGPSAHRTEQLLLLWSVAPPQPTSKESWHVRDDPMKASAASPPRPPWPTAGRQEQVEELAEQKEAGRQAGRHHLSKLPCTKLFVYHYDTTLIHVHMEIMAFTSSTHLHIAVLQVHFGRLMEVHSTKPVGHHLCVRRCCVLAHGAAPQCSFSFAHLHAPEGRQRW